MTKNEQKTPPFLSLWALTHIMRNENIYTDLGTRSNEPEYF